MSSDIKQTSSNRGEFEIRATRKQFPLELSGCISLQIMQLSIPIQSTISITHLVLGIENGCQFTMISHFIQGIIDICHQY